ncbi:uncharacterized protein LOC114960819 [Acropora millepora]|uniref:uncharacterized protein LOC114960819 n=1 Tax=Acropora millepora TaxID=45264 RepID=UPI001CF1389E|nr:uncharacterized protein LOC114960819 [Acropora millepora]
MTDCPSAQMEDEAVAMACCEAEMVHDYGKVYARKYSDFRDDQATLWTSMYEKNLGRKVSRLPPWEVSQTGRKESSERHFGDPTKKDFASIHLERAASTGSLGLKKHVHSPRGDKTAKKVGKGQDKERKSKKGKEKKSLQSSSEKD